MAKVLFYLDRLMHYHVATCQEIKRRIEQHGGKFILVAGENKRQNNGRVGLSEVVLRQQVYIPYYELNYRTYTVRWQPTLADVVRKNNPDILIVAGHVGDLTYWRLSLSKHRSNFKYVTWQCGYEYNQNRFKKKLTDKFLERFDYHLAYHTKAKEYLLEHGVKESRIMVIHNTIDERQIEICPRVRARKIVMAELELPEDRPIVLFVGTILAEKRLDVLIDAMRRLGPATASLVIVGDGPALFTLKSASADLEYVRYTGQVLKGVGRFFDAADVFVLPGTGGLAINEAMAHGLPIIASEADGSTLDLVSDGVNGFILKDGHSEEIAGYLRTLLADPQARLRMGEASRGRITTKYSFTAFVDRILDGLHAAISSGGTTK